MLNITTEQIVWDKLTTLQSQEGFSALVFSELHQSAEIKIPP